ncbi:hypothetical protein ELS19_04355 [Halogeometricum borinquense]|uniref:TIGR04206 family protein n=1 Tax=Halogeometricum borinquense TaxID=60847 RepID=A0A482TJY3_9EURY|nr:hypothetical protein [Halogeometricum borinquense]RYJ13275.1 hypothetical protein ELS19_04355 [Halogeometricum borinquense]
MVWVRSEYAGPLAVVLTVLSVLLPWNVTYSASISGGSVLFVRFPFAQIRYAFGVPFAEAVRLFDPMSAIAFQAGSTIQLAYEVWAVGAAVLAVALLVAIAYYFREDAVESGPVDPVRLLGGLLGLAGVVLAVATYLLVTRGFPGVPLPVGVVFLFVFAGLLLTVERT